MSLASRKPDWGWASLVVGHGEAGAVATRWIVNGGEFLFGFRGGTGTGLLDSLGSRGFRE